MKLLFILCCVIIFFLIRVHLSTAEYLHVSFIPADKKVLLVVGQDKTSIDEYVRIRGDSAGWHDVLHIHSVS